MMKKQQRIIRSRVALSSTWSWLYVEDISPVVPLAWTLSLGCSCHSKVTAYSQLCFTKRQTLKMHGPRLQSPQAAYLENASHLSTESWQGSTCGSQKMFAAKTFPTLCKYLTLESFFRTVCLCSVITQFLSILQCCLQTNVNKETQKSPHQLGMSFFLFQPQSPKLCILTFSTQK